MNASFNHKKLDWLHRCWWRMLAMKYVDANIEILLLTSKNVISRHINGARVRIIETQTNIPNRPPRTFRPFIFHQLWLKLYRLGRIWTVGSREFKMNVVTIFLVTWSCNSRRVYAYAFLNAPKSNFIFGSFSVWKLISSYFLKCPTLCLFFWNAPFFLFDFDILKQKGTKNEIFRFRGI